MKKRKVQKTNVMRLLEQAKVPYSHHTYAWDERHLDASSAGDGIGEPLAKIFKTLVATGDKTGVVVACIPAEHELDLKALATLSGNKKVDMLPMKDLEKTTGYIRGGCSPIGMTKQFPTFLASMAETMETVIISAGKRGKQVELAPTDLQHMTQARFAEISV